MIHRVVSLLLVPMLLLQGVSFAHSHDGTGVEEPDEHAQTRHLHCPLFGTHSHPHHHDGEHHHHDDQDDSDADAAPQGGDDTSGQQAPARDHDDDAVYAPEAMTNSVPGQQWSGSAGWFALVTTLGMVFTSIAPVPPPPRTHPPPLLPFGDCPLYLRTLTLLI